MHSTIRLQTLLNQQVHTILEETLKLLPQEWCDLFPSSSASAWEKVMADLVASNAIRRVRRTEAIIYQWAIAPQLSPLLSIPSATIAQKLVDLLTHGSKPLVRSDPGYKLRAEIWVNCRVTVYAHHLIQIEVSDRALASWLQQVIALPDLELTPSVFRREDSATSNRRSLEGIFPLQAAHARCCSLLRLGEREGLIKIYPADEKSLPQRIDWPNPLSWLQEEGQLRLVHPSERYLLVSGVEVLGDRTFSPSQIHFSERFFAFDAACRILGEIKAHAPQLAQARLGLILFSRHCLAQSLEIQGIEPLCEL
ncbi:MULTISPECIES: hypothetical protein [unclassified Leptolyngbya]|uniref:hypothetical protein n=1 Tax=unclassified Leptolyngbya TaxID=2650499 RepID=UPI001682C577|nr:MULTISPECIES: hypothetical protein [unclassified Leptolyngbya]MBD1912425.1 hypothetical protein [Leptolyngbya sp. FACHB-8]MBD2157926.1 hypothetical protein [Leptolyngbya sp. FACHB-16]